MASGSDTLRKPSDLGRFTERSLVIGAVALAALLLAYVVYQSTQLVLLVFCSVLLSALFRGAARQLRERTRLSDRAALGIVVSAVALLFCAGLWLIGREVWSQAVQFAELLPQATQNLAQQAQQYAWAQQLWAQLPSTEQLVKSWGSLTGQLPGFFSSVVASLADFAIMTVLALYLAFQPGLYRRGILHLIPPGNRAQAGQVLGCLSETLQHWLLGRTALMVVNGALTTLGLWGLGVSAPLALGIVAGVLNFVPNIGPLIASIPALLIAFMQGPQTALYVAGLYLLVQMLDGSVFTPLVDRRTVDVPPALNIGMQLLLSLLAGPMGLLVAAPLTAVLMVLVRELYVKGVLNDRSVEAT